MRISISKKENRLYLAILFAAVLVLLPSHFAKASCGIVTGTISDCILEGTSYFIYLIFTVIGKGIAALAGLLQWVINLPVYPADGQRIAVIDESWKIMRNFANMFFIVALIVMAFATIFDVMPGAAKYNARALFGRFLLTALLINFSLVLGVMVIQGTQVLNNTFLTAIGDMSGKLGQALNPSLLFPKITSTTTAAQAVDQGLFGSLVSLIFATVLAFTFLFSLLTAAIFAFVRIPIIWALLVVSPIAWILNIFPAGEGTFKRWWTTFIGWNMFLPIFLFFLYFGLYFLQGQGAVMKAIAGSTGTGTILGDTVTSFTFQMLFMYVMAGIFLIGGTIVAMKASMFSGTGVVGIAKWSRGVAARRLGLTGAKQAYEEKKAEIQGGQGRLGRIFGGPPPGLATSRRLFGVQGGNLRSQQEFVDRTSKEYSNLETQYRLGQVSAAEVKRVANSGSATNPKIYAYRKMLAKTGQLDPAIAQKTFSELKDNPLALEDFAKTASGAKWSALTGQNVRAIAKGASYTDATGTYNYASLRDMNGTAVRREAVKKIQDDKLTIADTSFDVNEFKEYINLQGGPATSDAKELIKSVGKYRPDLIYDLSRDPQYTSLNPRGLSRLDIFKSAVNNADFETLAFIPSTLWADPDFQATLTDKYNRRTTPVDKARFKTQVLDEIIKTPDAGAKATAAGTIMP